MSDKKMESQLIENTVDKRNKLITEAEEKSAKLIQQAESEVLRIKSESEKQVEHVINSEIRAVHDRIVGLAKVESRKNLMLTREKVISDVFDKAEIKLEKMIKDTTFYSQDVLSKLIIEAAKEIGEEELIVSANSQDMKHIQENIKELNAKLKEAVGGVFTLSDNSLKIRGGVIVSNKKGNKIYYNTLEGRLKSVRSSKAAEVAKLLEVI